MSEHIEDSNKANDTPEDGTSVSLTIPSHLHRKLKSRAALAGMHLKTYIIGILVDAIHGSAK